MNSTLYESTKKIPISCLNEQFFLRYTADLVPDAPEKDLHFIELEDDEGLCVDAEYMNPRTLKIVSDADAELPAPVPLLFFEYLISNPELQNLLEEEYECSPERADLYSDAFRTAWVTAANAKIQEAASRIYPKDQREAIADFLDADPLRDIPK